MGLTSTTTRLSYARNELIKVGESFIFDKVGDMIYYAVPLLDKANTFGADAAGFDQKFFGETSGSYILWDASDDQLEFVNSKLTFVNTSTATDPGVQIYAQFTSTKVASGKQLQGMQIKASWGGTADSTEGGVVGAEIKARTTGDSITHTLGQARAIVGNVDCKKATFSKGYAFEAAIDLSAGGTITEAIGFRSFLNNSGTATHSYAFYADAVSDYPWEYGLYVKEGMVQTPIYIKNVDWGSGVDVQNIFSRITIDAAMGSGSAYVSQNHLITSGAFTINEAAAVSAYVNLGTGEITASGRVCALQAMISGDGTAGTVAGDDKLYVAYIANRGTMIDTDAILLVHNQSAAGADAMVQIQNLSNTEERVTDIFELDVGASTNFFNIASIEGCVESQAGGTLTITEKLKVKIGENTRYIAVGTIA